MKENLDKISKLDHIHVSLDLWSSISRQSILGVKIHFIDADWKLQTWTVGFKHFSHRKSGHNIRVFFKDLFTNQLKVTPKKVIKCYFKLLVQDWFTFIFKLA